MKKSTWISLFALLISIAGLMIALIAYFKRRSCALCDDLENDMVEFYDDDEDEDEDECADGCCCCGEDCTSQHTEPESEVKSEPVE